MSEMQKATESLLNETVELMREAVKNQMAHARTSHMVNRTGWSDEQFVEDARIQMGDLDGSVLDLVNGHVFALLREVDRLRADLADARDSLRAVSDDMYAFRAQRDHARADLVAAQRERDALKARVAVAVEILADAWGIEPQGNPAIAQALDVLATAEEPLVLSAGGTDRTEGDDGE